MTHREIQGLMERYVQDKGLAKPQNRAVIRLDISLAKAIGAVTESRDASYIESSCKCIGQERSFAHFSRWTYSMPHASQKAIFGPFGFQISSMLISLGLRGRAIEAS
jgi:hypothetical protein